MATIQFKDSYNREAITSAEIVTDIPNGYRFDCFEVDMRCEDSSDNYYRLYMDITCDGFNYVAIACPSEY